LMTIIIIFQEIKNYLHGHGHTSQNIIFQKSSCKNRPIIYYLGPKIY
jgi:hypothetical protein